MAADDMLVRCEIEALVVAGPVRRDDRQTRCRGTLEQRKPRHVEVEGGVGAAMQCHDQRVLLAGAVGGRLETPGQTAEQVGYGA